MNDENEDRLRWALIQDDVRTVRKFINSGWRTNELWREEIPRTAMRGSEKVLLYLLKEKIADVNELYDGLTLFDEAVMSWHEKEPWVKNLVPSHGYVYPEDLIDAVYMVSLLALRSNSRFNGALRASPHLNNNVAWYVEFNGEDPNSNQMEMARSMYGINIAPVSSFKKGEPWDIFVSIDFRSYNFINNEAYVICRGYKYDSWRDEFRFRKINGLWVMAMHNGSNCYYRKRGHPIEVPGKHNKTLSATGGQEAGRDSMKDGQGAADHAIFQGLDEPPAGASKPWNPASRLTAEPDREYRVDQHERGSE